ncbi:MAG TPA: DNA polymerase domain-containing protein, partial [Herpetosiphonaceae bacterium]
LLSSTRLPRGGRRQDIRFSVAGRELIDTLEAVWRHDFVTRSLPGYGLKAVAKAFGVAGPDRVYIPGHAVYATYQSDPERSRRYALDDVAEVAALAPRLLGASFALAGMAPRSYGRIANAGPAMGILEPMLIRAYLRSGAAPPCEPFPPSAEGHAGGATFLYAAGVARQVVKADIASMYPSLMRIYQLGPACDPLKALLTLVGRLTGLRLNHKAAARAAAPGSHDSYHHEAVQAAMKLLINSAYGYMGAESMAMFADRAAADAVTRHGREVLEQVVAGLRDRGMALLEADTDGVYFAAPPGWSEQRERALVAEVAATLPDGLKLEYDGRYQAMLSHEVKNYTLLTYDGRLISRGVAFASSRAEPFGGRFLDTALRCLLTGDVPGIQQAYFAMADALRRHALPVRDVTTYARLTKQPADYLAARERLREAPYEALLAAGRRDWKPGERVRFYRSGQGAVWVPEDAPEDATWPPYDADHYIHVLRTSFVSRLRKAFDPADFDSLLRDGGQRSMFDPPLSAIQPRWIIAENPPDAAPR